MAQTRIDRYWYILYHEQQNYIWYQSIIQKAIVHYFHWLQIGNPTWDEWRGCTLWNGSTMLMALQDFWLLTSVLQKPGVIGRQTCVNCWNSQVLASFILRHDTDDNLFRCSTVFCDLSQRSSLIEVTWCTTSRCVSKWFMLIYIYF